MGALTHLCHWLVRRDPLNQSAHWPLHLLVPVWSVYSLQGGSFCLFLVTWWRRQERWLLIHDTDYVAYMMQQQIGATSCTSKSGRASGEHLVSCWVCQQYPPPIPPFLGKHDRHFSSVTNFLLICNDKLVLVICGISDVCKAKKKKWELERCDSVENNSTEVCPALPHKKKKNRGRLCDSSLPTPSPGQNFTHKFPWGESKQWKGWDAR